jgi:hypothetical protein
MRRSAWLVAALALAWMASPAPAAAQLGRGGPRAPPQQQPKQEPKGPTPEEQEELHNAYQRASEPEIAPPTAPLTVSPEIAARIGSDYSPGKLSVQDSELSIALYYRRRSLPLDMDVLFPLFWHVRDRESHVTVVGPAVHREAPGENDNWLAPLFFQGHRKDGGYFHSLPLLTTTHWGPTGAFTLVGPYFRDRSGSDVNLGVVPFFFHGDNGSSDGNRRIYTLVPPLLYYHSEHELDSSANTIIGPVVAQSDTKRDTFDVLPFYFHIRGRPDREGVAEEHTTVFPFFHYGHDPEAKLLVLPGALYRQTKTSETLLTPIVSFAKTHNGAAEMTAVGPIVPLVWNYRDTEVGAHAWAVVPFAYVSDSPAGHDWLVPVAGHFKTYSQSTTTWVFPSFTFNTNTHGWENALHPLIYVGRNDQSSHTVVAPVFWDFASPTGRTTIGVPFFWRFAEGRDESVLQIAANTVYIQKRVAGGTDWQFHFAPFFSYGQDPRGYFWNLFFGMAGYSRHGTETQTRVLWIPFNGGTPNQTATIR